MLTIRMQRTGRKGLANFRVVVQDSRFSPSSGRIVAQLGHHNPHTKETVLDKEKASQYLQNGAQPSPRVVKLLEAEKVTLPSWVEKPANDKKRSIKSPEKLRKNQPKEEAPAEESTETTSEEPAEEKAAETPQNDTPADEDSKSTEDDSSTAETAEDKPAEA